MLKTVVNDLGVHPNTSSDIGRTMMIMASMRGDLEKLKTLADLGADVNQADNNGRQAYLPAKLTVAEPETSPRQS